MFGLTRKRTPQQLWNLHKEDFLKIYAHEQSTPLTHKQLEKRLILRNGKQVYGFPEGTALPVERYGQVQKFLQLQIRALTDQELGLMLDEIDKALMDGISNKDKKAAARIGSIVHQIRQRKEIIIHTELLYNLLACQLILEDEDPLVYNNEIQMQKVEWFKEETANSNSYFFFQQKELKKLNELWNLSEEEWNKSWEESLIKQKALKETLATYSQTASKKSVRPTQETKN